jgi:hypothetical protein
LLKEQQRYRVYKIIIETEELEAIWEEFGVSREVLEKMLKERFLGVFVKAFRKLALMQLKGNCKYFSEF